MKQLRDMGLEDIPTVEGLSSSMRQYALSSLSMQVNFTDSKERRFFGTLDPHLLRRADELEKRFGMRPVDGRKMLGL
jgi:hypothetical protein